MKIDKDSLSQSKRPREATRELMAGQQGDKVDPSSLAAPDASGQAANAEPDAVHRPSGRSLRVSRRSLPTQSLAVFITFLLLAFGAGILIANLSLSPSRPVPVAVSLSPLMPASISPSPSPPPTATATSLDGGGVLETLYVDIAPADMEKIVAKRKEALELGILLSTGADYVPATIRLRHEEIPVELRLKGDWIDHIAQEKWSFRVRTLDDGDLSGMRVFSLQDASRRSFLDEWLFLENLRQEDVLAPRYDFFRVVLNGEYKGIYALEEGFSRELLESQRRREGPIIRYDEDLVWEYRAFYDDQIIPRGVNEFYIIDEFQSQHIASDPTLAAQRDAAVGSLRALWTGERAAAEVFDLNAMGTFLALTDLWSAPHGLIWHNLRYYYNPITTYLEPIAFDSDALTGELDMVGLSQDAFYRDPYLQAAYVEALQRTGQPGYVEAVEEQLGAQYEALRAALEPEFGSDVLTPPWDVLRRRQELVRQMLRPYQTVYAYVQRSSPGSATLIDVGNLLDLPLEIVGFNANGTLLPADRDWVLSESDELLVPAPAEDPDALILRPLAPDATSMGYVHLSVPSSELPTEGTNNLKIVTRLWGMSEEHQDNVLPGYVAPLAKGPLPQLPTLAQALAQHPYLERVSGEQMLRIDGGTWDVEGNLVLPAGYGLVLTPGTVLQFGRDNFLLASGPLDFRGTEDAPIVLQPIPMNGAAGNQSGTGEWWGVVVLGADTRSIWKYVTVERASAVDQDGWTLTGGVTFYESPIRMERSRILDSRAEDGLNVVRTEFEITDSEFGNSVSDAIDADFAFGTIKDSSFHDIGGDGIDVSGSDVKVHRVKLLNIADKGISVGEASQLTADEIHFENVALGIVSKDLSNTALENATIIRAQIAGLAAYNKKPVYGPATLVANGVRFAEMPQERHTLVQIGSWVELDGRRIEGTDVDVDALYQR